MDSRKLWDYGNLYTGYPWGVEVEDYFGSGAIYGPYSTESEAEAHAINLATEWPNVSIVRLETPTVRRIQTEEVKV